MDAIKKMMEQFARECSDDELFDTLKIHNGYEDSAANDLMKSALRAEIERRDLKSGGTL